MAIIPISRSEGAVLEKRDEYGLSQQHQGHGRGHRNQQHHTHRPVQCQAELLAPGGGRMRRQAGQDHSGYGDAEYAQGQLSYGNPEQCRDH